jgi:hypothetical protein
VVPCLKPSITVAGQPYSYTISVCNWPSLCFVFLPMLFCHWLTVIDHSRTVTHGLSGPSRRSWRSRPCQNATVGAFPVMIAHTVRSTCATTNCSLRLPPFLLSTRRGQEATNCQSCPPFRPFSAERRTLLSLRPVYGQCRRSSRLDVLTVRFACKCHAPMGGSLAVVPAARSGGNTRMALNTSNIPKIPQISCGVHL